MRPGRHYRRDLFTAGLERLGYQVSDRYFGNPRPGDLLLSWNRNRNIFHIAEKYQKAGAAIIITENGYVPGPDGEKHFALARDYHNGCGRWPAHTGARFRVDIRPWRERGDHILILPQRGIGSPHVAMPIGWAVRMRDRLARMTKREIRIRRHPGLMRNYRPLDEDLDGCWAAVTWGSGAGVKALCAGIPVFHHLDGWIGRAAALPFTDQADLEDPYLGDRAAMLGAVTWAQWSGDEIQSGEPIARLLAL